MTRSEGQWRPNRLLAGAAACCLVACLPAAAWAQAADQSGGGSTGPNTSSGGSAGPSAGGSFSQSPVPGVGSSLMQSGPPQPGSLGGGTGNTLPALPGQTLGQRINTALGLQAASQPGQPAVQFTPAITVQQGWTDNVFNTPGMASQDAFFTTITPSLGVSADTERLQASATYAPSVIEYEPNYGQSTVAQNLSGHAHAILVPDTLFVDASAFAADQTITGGFGPSATVLPNNANTAQDYGVTLSPYLQHRFGGFGIGEIGVALTATGQLVPGGTVAAPQPGLPAVGIGNQIMNSSEEHIAFTSGEDFGRWLSNAYLSATQYGGTGVFVGAYDNIATYEAGYAITRNITALATIGWQTLYYSGIPPIHVDAPVWNVGVQLTPNADSTIIVRYGEIDGITSAYLNGTYMPTPRLRFTANYSVTLSTDPQQLGANLFNATTDPFGNPVNVQTGQPLLQNNNFLGLMTGVYKLEVAALAGSLLFDRDTFQLGVNQQQETPLNTIPGGVTLGAMSGTFGTLSWSHDVSQAVKATLFAQYGVTQAAYNGANYDSTVLVGSATVSYAISTTLSAMLQYTHTVSRYANALPGFASDIVLVGLTKTF